MGLNDNQTHTRTHLGHLLNPGDIVLGFDFSTANLNEPNFDKYEENHKDQIPDVLLVKKYYADKAARNRIRLWKLKRLNVDGISEGSSANRDFMDFMEDLEEDTVIRQNINVFKDKNKIENRMAIDEDEIENIPQITLQEMLEDLHLEIEDT